MNCKTCNRNFTNEQEAYYVYYTEPKTYQCWLCAMEQKYKEYTDNQYLTTRLLIDASMYNYYITECTKERLLQLNECWLYEMAKYGKLLNEMHTEFTEFIQELKDSPALTSWLTFNVHKCIEWGSGSFKSKDFSVLLKSCAGRTLITFSNDKCDFTIIGPDDSSYLSKWGWQGVYGTLVDLYKLMINVLKIFPELQKDDEVFIV